MALAACRRGPGRGDDVRVARAVRHHGRTPPCTEAILEAGIARVVVASDDPTPKASGRGPGILRDEGVRGGLRGRRRRARRRGCSTSPSASTRAPGRPLVVFKSAMTLDGKVATRTGDSQWISGEASRARAHRWRAESDAVAVGIGTALADDPQLTARDRGRGAPAAPRRVRLRGAPAARLAARPRRGRACP